jgi:opacity protein-like surface antigen
VETATIATAYAAEATPGFDVAFEFDAFRHVGFSLAGTLYNRDLGGEFDASFPHPLYFDHAREVSGGIRGKMKETAGHLSVVAFGQSGPVEVSGWAGVSLFKVEADLLTDLTYSQAYPYDSVSITSMPATTVSDQPLGFNVGASLEWRFSKSVGFGIQGRYSRAKAKFSVPNAEDVEVDAGGFQVGGGLRLHF